MSDCSDQPTVGDAEVAVTKESCLPGLSVAIVTYAQSIGELEATLESLAIAVQRARALSLLGITRLVFVDNGPADDDWKALQSLMDTPSATSAFDHRLLITGHGNVGFGRGHNLALYASEEDFHLTLNPDVLIEPDALLNGCDYLLKHPGVVLASPAATWPDGSRQFLCKRYPAAIDLVVRGFAPRLVRDVFRRRLSSYELQDVCREEPVEGIPIVSGCFMLARRQAMVEVGGFSEEFFMYFEDFDLSIRIREIGQIAYVPQIKITHLGGHAARKGWRHVRMFGSSAFLFYQRHGWKLV